MEFGVNVRTLAGFADHVRRAELGLGMGNARAEFDDAGIPFRPYRERLERTEALLADVRARLGARRVPVAIGTISERGLAFAAREADIVAFSGLHVTRAGLQVASPEETDARVAHVREQAGGRAFVSDALLQAVAVDGDPRERARTWSGDGPLDPDAVLASPYALFAPSPQAALEELHRRRERWGFTSFVTHAPSLEALGSIIALHR